MKALRTLLKALAWIAGSLVALGVVLYLVLLAINWQDRQPSETALRFAAAFRGRAPIADAENGFVYASGFYVKPGDDPQAAGIRRIDWLKDVYADAPSEWVSPPEKDYDYKAARSAAVQKVSDACRENGSECVAAIERNGAVFTEWVSSEQWLFERYQTLISRPGWLETAPIGPNILLPAYGTVYEGQKLLFAHAWMRAGEADAAAVRNLLSQDLRFWRHMLESSDILITKMIAVSGLKRHFKLGNLVLRRLPANLEAAGRPSEWAAEITLAERSMARTWVGEWMFLSSVLEQERQVPGDLTFTQRMGQRAFMPLLQAQDLANQWADTFERANVELDVPYEQYRAGAARAEAIMRGTEGELPPLRLYNPSGAVLRWLGGGQYTNYSQRAVDIEGVRRVALLASELRSHGITAAQVSAEVSASAIREPYGNEPFGWDEKKGKLIFTGLERSLRAVHEIVY